MDYWRRVRAELSWRVLAVTAALAMLVASQALARSQYYDLWTPWDIALSWSAYYAELATIALALLLVVVLVEQVEDVRPAWRAVLVVPALGSLAFLLVWLANWRLTGSWQPSSWLLLVGESTKLGLLGLFGYALRALHRRAEKARDASRALEADQAELELQAGASQLQLLQAQIEPHFLFNTLANIRRLFHTEPHAGAAAIDSLKAYLRAALPQARRENSTLGEEFDLLQAYLHLFKVRMGRRLDYRLELPPSWHALPYPPMLLVTLVENAIKHGIAPTDLGGMIKVRAQRRDGDLMVEVTDDGVGFGATAGGAGVGLVNIRRQLAARYGGRAKLTLESAPGRGVTARVVVPWPAHPADGRHSAEAALGVREPGR